MADTEVLALTDSDSIGRVASVDTHRVYIEVKAHDRMSRIAVGNLLAIQGTTAQEYLIAIVERVTRQIAEEALLAQEDEDGLVPIGEAKNDTIRAVLVGTFRSKEGDRTNIFKRGADSFPQIDRDSYVIEAGNLQRFMNLLAKDLPDEKHLRLGNFVMDRSAAAIADGDRFFQRHACILGSTGSGKSWSVALILERASALSFPNLIVLDMHGEYAPLTTEVNSASYATWFRVAGPGDLDSPKKNVLFLPYWLLNREEMLSMLLDRSDQNAPNQAARFTSHVRALKDAELEANKLDSVRATFTVDSPIPYGLDELMDKLKADDTERVEGARAGSTRQGDWFGKLTRFIARLETRAEDRRYGFMFQPPSASRKYGWLAEQIDRLLSSDGKDRGIKIIDFSEVPSDVLPIVVGVLARLLYDVQFWLEPNARTPVTIVCDEAHLYLPARFETDAIERRALDVFERIAKEGRKYGVSLLVVSQRPSDVSRTILSQCNNFLVLRLTNDQDQLVVRHLMPDSMAGITDVIPLLDIGEGLLLGDAILLPTRIQLDAPTIFPASATRDFWSEWNSSATSADAIKQAVETLRRQTRPVASDK